MPMKMCLSGKHFFNPDIHAECPSCQQDAPMVPPNPSSGATAERLPEGNAMAAMQPTVLVNDTDPGQQGTNAMHQSPKTTPIMPTAPAGAAKTTPIMPQNADQAGKAALVESTGPKTTIITGGSKLAPGSNAEPLVNLPVVGWLVVTQGPGTGRDFRLVQGENRIGSATDNEVCLNFGDDTISREAHAIIVFDHHANEFFMERGKSRNLAQLNGKTVRGEPNIVAGDRIQLGETELLFVPFCGAHHSW